MGVEAAICTTHMVQAVAANALGEARQRDAIEERYHDPRGALVETAKNETKIDVQTVVRLAGLVWDRIALALRLEKEAWEPTLFAY